LNYIKAVLTKEYQPVRAKNIREFILACKSRKIPLISSQTVCMVELKKYRPLLRKELQAKGFEFYHIERILNVAEGKIKDFLEKIKIDDSIQPTKLPAVNQFFDKFAQDPRVLNLKQKKQNVGQLTDTGLPGADDRKIIAEALTFQNLFFATTDEHFFCLQLELEGTFDITIIHDDNALQKLRQWGWQ